MHHTRRIFRLFPAADTNPEAKQHKRTEGAQQPALQVMPHHHTQGKADTAASMQMILPAHENTPVIQSIAWIAAICPSDVIFLFIKKRDAFRISFLI